MAVLPSQSRCIAQLEGNALAARLRAGVADIGFRDVDADDGAAGKPLGERGDNAAGPAADIEQLARVRRIGEFDEWHGETLGPAAEEALVGLAAAGVVG